MIPENILSALRIVYDKLHNKNILWILTGSTSLVIQGVDVKINDIDISTDKEGSQKIDELLSHLRIRKPNYSTTDKYRSYFGAYMIEGIKVETLGDFQYKMKDGSWSKPSHHNKIITKEFKGMTLSLLPLEQELQEYENMENHDKARKIKQALNKSSQNNN